MRIPITASQWHANGDHPDDGPAGREGLVVRYYRHPDHPGTRLCPQCSMLLARHGWIDSGPDGYTVCPGDWVITTADGHHIPVKSDAFFALCKELLTA